ncbi:MAG TPA: hypothetical protein VKB35_00280 [Ktedonobacteraceae bacterium]|nr:hypothetical protein [Ktedonobacteraceae bacterium]
MDQSHGRIYLFTLFGTRANELEATRSVHNRVAGAPEDVAAAKSLSDLSHMVYTPVDEQEASFVIMDLWTDLSGFNQFFSEPKRAERQAKAGIFTQNEPVVWEPAEGFFAYHIPVPTGHHDRFFALLRGPVVSREQARTQVDQVRMTDIHKARAAGHLSHEAYFRLTQPGTPSSLEFLSVDGWFDLEGMMRYYQELDAGPALDGLFTAPPSTWLLKHPAGEWIEW